MIGFAYLWTREGACCPAPSITGKVVLILVLQFENYPLFCGKSRLVSSKEHLFHDKTLTFQSKINPLFCGKTLTFQPK